VGNKKVPTPKPTKKEGDSNPTPPVGLGEGGENQKSSKNVSDENSGHKGDHRDKPHAVKSPVRGKIYGRESLKGGLVGLGER